MSTVTAAQLANLQRVIVSEALFYQEHDCPMRQLVKKIDMPKGARQVDVPRYHYLDAQALTDGVDLVTGSALSETTISITTSEHGVKVIITDKCARQNIDDIFRSAGKQMSNSMARRMDLDLLALLDGFSGSTPGASVAWSMTQLRNCYTELKSVTVANGGPAPDPIVGVLHPRQFHDVITDLAPVGTYPIPTGPSAEKLASYFRGKEKVYGIPIYIDGNITVDTLDDAKGGVFSKESLCVAVQKEWSIERERDASLRAYEIVCVGDWGEKELMDAWGFEAYSDAAALI
uniref:Putative capsid protein n=1 Tax=viral metagenome TaxID=1070528 RepID=A0A6H1ZRN1_9ZZZZ